MYFNGLIKMEMYLTYCRIYFVYKTTNKNHLPQFEKLYRLRAHTPVCQGVWVHVFGRVWHVMMGHVTPHVCVLICAAQMAVRAGNRRRTSTQPLHREAPAKVTSCIFPLFDLINRCNKKRRQHVTKSLRWTLTYHAESWWAAKVTESLEKLQIHAYTTW